MRGLQRGEHEELVEGRKGRSERLGLRSDVNQRCPACLDWTGRERKKRRIDNKERGREGLDSTAQTALVAVGCSGFPCHFYSAA
jgi:hypothetical protein